MSLIVQILLVPESRDEHVLLSQIASAVYLQQPVEDSTLTPFRPYFQQRVERRHARGTCAAFEWPPRADYSPPGDLCSAVAHTNCIKAITALFNRADPHQSRHICTRVLKRIRLRADRRITIELRLQTTRTP